MTLVFKPLHLYMYNWIGSRYYDRAAFSVHRTLVTFKPKLKIDIILQPSCVLKLIETLLFLIS